jgi:hypothetical protein
MEPPRYPYTDADGDVVWVDTFHVKAYDSGNYDCRPGPEPPGWLATYDYPPPDAPRFPPGFSRQR